MVRTIIGTLIYVCLGLPLLSLKKLFVWLLYHKMCYFDLKKQQATFADWPARWACSASQISYMDQEKDVKRGSERKRKM